MISIVGILLAGALQAPAVDEIRIDEAVQRGAAWLKKAGPLALQESPRTRELLLLTLAHAGLPREDAFFKQHFDLMVESTLYQTYNVALQAMVLEEVERVEYQGRIWMCAQFLVDNQGSRGQWGYGERVASYGTPTVAARQPTPTTVFPTPGRVVVFGRRASPTKPRVRRKLSVRKRKAGSSRGDNSNSQYAALGLRACHDAGIQLPPEVVERARSWWLKSFKVDTPARGQVATGARTGGWGYTPGADPYGSMTAGGLGALVICDYILGRDWKREPSAVGSAAWMGAAFEVTVNPPKRGSFHHYYYLYALERAGILYKTKRFGSHDWYAEGAAYLLKAQNPDGSWPGTTNTCFAILFLKRATRPLVATPSKR